MADLVPKFVEFSRQPAQALARPAQRRQRIAARVGLDRRVQLLEQNRVRFRQRFASPSRTANATELQRRRRIEFLQAASDRARGDARDPGNRGYAAMPCRPGFRRSEKPSLPFIQLRQYRCIALPELLERIFINHPQTYDAPRPRGIPATSLLAQNRFSYSLTSPLRRAISPKSGCQTALRSCSSRTFRSPALVSSAKRRGAWGKGSTWSS